MTDFSKVVIRASALGLIMTEPKLKADKDAGNLSETSKGYLRKVYKEVKWGRVSDIQNKYVSKGRMVEEDSITLISSLDKKFYIKNTERLTNDYFTGEPDVFEGESILQATKLIDIKSSWNADTFLSTIGETIEKIYWWQGQCYMDLTGCSEYEVAYCLVDTPQHIINQEKRKLFYEMDVATEESPEYLAACAELETNMTFSDIPPNERRYSLYFQKDPEAIERAREKVIKCREWLAYFEKLHMKL